MRNSYDCQAQATSCVAVFSTKGVTSQQMAMCRAIAEEEEAHFRHAEGRAWFVVQNYGVAYTQACSRDICAKLADIGIKI